MQQTSPIRSRLLDAVPGIAYGFGAAAELVPAALRPRWPARPVKRQVHGARVAEVSTVEQRIGEADGFWTRAPDIPVSVITADCIPLLLARRDGAMVAAVHAGWRGLIGGILETMWDDWRARGERPADWVAALGPCICGACYEVSEELAAQFIERYCSGPQALPASLVCPAHRRLDLGAVAEARLRQLGVGAVERLGLCTLCARGADGDFVFRSYRRGDRQSQQHAGLLILP